MIDLNVNVNFDARAVTAQVERAIQKAQFALDQQVLKDSNFFIPKDTGNLEASSIRASQPGTGHIAWATPYARRLYYNPQYNFSKDSNPNAQGLWFEAAKARHVVDWNTLVRRIVRRELQ